MAGRRRVSTDEYVNGQRVRCYDNGGKTADQYTVLYPDEPEEQYCRGAVNSVCMSAYPFHPQGIGQHGAAMPGRHLGTRTPFADLPPDCQQLVRQDTSSGVRVAVRAWHWPDHRIGLRESRRLRDEHNAVYNSHARLLSALEDVASILAANPNMQMQAAAGVRPGNIVNIGDVVRAALAATEREVRQ